MSFIRNCGEPWTQRRTGGPVTHAAPRGITPERCPARWPPPGRAGHRWSRTSHVGRAVGPRRAGPAPRHDRPPEPPVRGDTSRRPAVIPGRTTVRHPPELAGARANAYRVTRRFAMLLAGNWGTQKLNRLSAVGTAELGPAEFLRGAVPRVQAGLLLQEAPGHDNGRVPGLLREPAHTAGEEDREAGHTERGPVRATLPDSRREPGDRRNP
ncbi:hypothetical protein FRAHR75_1070002 [Frankia sp. Hr75.2]|nr:hypothetical protein FRAHR75_1070002 [Frankia sp. Hr75.2]